MKGKLVCEVCGQEIDETKEFPKFGMTDNLKVFCSKDHFLRWLMKKWNLEIIHVHSIPIKGTPVRR